MTQTHRLIALFLFILVAGSLLSASDQIPAVAWRIPIGRPPAHPGGRKTELTNIDDGFWQSAPVGGIGAGTFSRSYRGTFERWHVKAGVHKYQNVPANQFAVFAQAEGGAAVAQVLSTASQRAKLSRRGIGLIPAGGGDSAALCPKSWFAYRSDQLPVKLTVEQFLNAQNKNSFGKHVSHRHNGGAARRPVVCQPHGARGSGSGADAQVGLCNGFMTSV